MYREVGEKKPSKAPAPRPTTNSATTANVATEVVEPPAKPSAKESKIRVKLEEAKIELKIKGELIYPPPQIDLSDFKFDAAHTQGDKHPHDVTEEEARKFVAEAYFAIAKIGTNSYNFWGKKGAAYVQPNLKRIRTAFKSEEYAPPYRKLIEVYENAIGNL